MHPCSSMTIKNIIETEHLCRLAANSFFDYIIMYVYDDFSFNSLAVLLLF